MRNPSLPLDHWPEADRRAWAVAIAEGDVLDGRGPAAHWRKATRRTNIHGYGRWLAFLQRFARHELKRRLTDRCTSENVKAYLEQLKSSVAPVTVAGSIISLAEMLRVMAPGHDWSRLTGIGSALKRTARPSRDKRARMLPSQKMYRTVLRMLQQCATEPICGRNQLTAFRNLLMLALMIACPLRVKNFVELRVGSTLLDGDNVWSIHIPADEHKNGYPLLLTVPERLVPFLDVYRSKVRPQLASGRDPGTFWLTAGGRGFTEHALYLLFMKVTLRYFGKALNPHLFRDCAATSMATVLLSGAMAARSLLGHQQFETTERYYIKAEQLEASRTINQVIRQAKMVSDT